MHLEAATRRRSPPNGPTEPNARLAVSLFEPFDADGEPALDALEGLSDDEVLALFDDPDDVDEPDEEPGRPVVDVAIPIDNYPPAPRKERAR